MNECCVFKYGLFFKQGSAELAAAVASACQSKSDFKFLYDLDLTIEEKIATIARKIYGAADIDISAVAQAAIDRYKKQGFNNLPICMAKTHLSFTSDPALKGAPTGTSIENSAKS